MTDPAFWGATIFFPIVLVIILSIIRHYKHCPHIQATDIFVVAGLVDLALLVDSRAYDEFIHPKFDDGFSRGVILMLLVIDLALLVFCLLEVEPKVVKWNAAHFHNAPGDGHSFPFALTFVMWGSSIAIFSSNIGIMTGRIVL